MRYVTDTGRALSKGRVTRASLNVKRSHRKQGKPLPFDLQCHPVALTRTPQHPRCYTYKPQYGLALHYERLAEREGNTCGFAQGAWLSGEGAYRVVVDGYGEFRHNDLYQAMGWASAARSFGFSAEVYC